MIKAYEKYEAELTKEAADKVGGRPKKEDEKPSSNLNAVSDKVRVAAEVAKKIGMSEKTYRDAKYVVENGTAEQRIGNYFWRYPSKQERTIIRGMSKN